MDAHHGSIAAGLLHRVAADLAVVLFPYPLARGEVNRAHQLEQVRAHVGAFRHIAHGRNLGPGLVFLRRDVGALIFRRVVGKRAQRNVADHFAVEFENHVAGVGHFADHGEIEFPLLEDRLGHGFLAGLKHHEHTLLAFREHHLVRRHRLFAAGHGVHVQANAGTALAGHFDRRGGEPGRAHVLNRDDCVGGHEFEACLDQQLFGEGIAHLHGRALFVRMLVEIGRGHGGAVDAVAAGLRTDVDDRITKAGGGRVEDLVGIGDAHGHGVDEDVAVVSLVEVGLAPDGGHAHAVPVGADAFDHALHKMLHLGVIGATEAQRVHVGDRARAHGEDVAQNAADAGGRALERLDVAGVVMAFHLEDGGLPIADVDHAGVLARAADDPGSLGRQFLQVEAARLVRAVLRPHDREDTEFDKVRLSTKGVQNALVFFGIEAVRLDDVRGDFAHARRLSHVRRGALDGMDPDMNFHF